jgi:hypothetical protein
MYTQTDADDFRATLTAPDGPWAKADSKLRNAAIAAHDQRVAQLVAEGKLAAPSAPAPVTQQEQLWSLRESEKMEFNAGVLNQLTEGQVALLQRQAAKFEGLTPAQLEALVDKNIFEYSHTQEFENSRRHFEDGSLKGPPQRGHDDPSRIGDAKPAYDRMSAEAAEYLKANPQIGITIQMARADHAILRSLSAAFRAAAKK